MTGTWYSWTADNSSATTTSTTTSTWNIWNGEFASNTTVSDIWFYWTDHASSTVVCHGENVTITNCTFGYWCDETFANPAGPTPPPTAEELARLAAYNQEAAARAEALRKEKAAADEKALELLQDLITNEEFETYQKTGRLLVRGRNHDYLVQRDSGWVVRCEKGKVADLCMHLDNYHAYSKHDNVIAMKLFLEGREDEFNREASLCGRREPDSVETKLLRVVNG